MYQDINTVAMAPDWPTVILVVVKWEKRISAEIADPCVFCPQM